MGLPDLCDCALVTECPGDSMAAMIPNLPEPCHSDPDVSDKAFAPSLVLDKGAGCIFWSRRLCSKG